MAFFKNMWKGSGKHRKLEPGDEKCLAKDLEGEPSSVMSDSVSFNVKYLGSTIVSNNTTTTSAVDTILTMAKVTKRKKCTVTVMVTLNGIMVTDSKTGNLILDASVYRISNCSTDPRGNIFTFFSINKNDITECHAFQCSKRKMVRNSNKAQNVTLTVAHSFRAAYENWQRGHQVCSQLMEQKPVNGRTSKKHLDVPSLIDLETNDDVIETNDNSSNSWVRFDKDETSEIMPKNNKNIQLVQPTNYFPSAPHLAENFNDNFVWT